MSGPSDPRSSDRGQAKRDPRGEIVKHEPLLDEARQALASNDRERLFQYIAENPFLLDADQRIRWWWVSEISRLQGDVVAYERILRYYQDMGAPAIRGYSDKLREQIGPGEEAATRARKELLEIGQRFLQAAITRWDPWKDDVSAKKARDLLQDAHKELSRFYRSVRREAAKHRRRWDRLLRDERITILSDTPEAGSVLEIVTKLWGMFPEAQWRLPLYHPYFYYADHPEEYMKYRQLKPSELAWKALGQLMSTGEATLKRWVQGKRRPRPRA